MNLWTFVHFFSFIVYTLAVCYVMVKNPHAVINWILSMLFFMFALWSACSTILDNTGVDMATAAIVMRVQSVGWASFISYFFLFILYLTNNRKLITGPLLITLIIVIPGIFIYQNINGQMLECCRPVSYGMAGQWKNSSVWPALYFIYYVMMFLGGTILLFRYRNTTRVKSEKNMVDILLWSAIAVFALGTFFSVFLNYMHVYFPVDANVVFLIFVLGFIFSAEKYETFNLSSTRNADRIMDLITDGIVLLDRIGAVTTANHAALEIFGYAGAPEASQGYDFIESVIRRAGVAADGVEIINSEITFSDSKGNEKTVLVSSRALLKGKQHSGRVCTVRDITTMKKADRELVEKVEELKRSNQDLESFAYVASHDLKEPLSMVTDYLQLIRKKFKDKLDKDGNDFLNNVSEGANRMSGLIESLLDYSRVTRAGREYSAVNTASVVSRVLSGMKFNILEKKAAIEVKGTLPEVKADRIQMEQLFRNLIMNALKFSSKKPPVTITISAEKKGGCFEFTVKDNGIGVEKSDLERIFQIFQRVNAGNDYEGAGVGLAICKKIAESHGGKIWAVSEGPGKGSSFIFTLPV